MLAEGSTAPPFCLPDQNGEEVCLANMRGKSNVVLFFYPMDFTPGCIREVCAFRDAFADLRGMDAEVIGVSSDSAKRHLAFSDRYQLPFYLLSDVGGVVRKRFLVPLVLGLFTSRVTYVIDKQGTVVRAFKDGINATRHVQEALDALTRLEA